MIVCWWHVGKRCDDSLSTAGGFKDRRLALEKELLGQLLGGESGDGGGTAPGGVRVGADPGRVEDLIGYLKKRQAFIPDYQQRQRAGLWIASTRVEIFDDRAV